jgi:putative MATE family efflux protein
MSRGDSDAPETRPSRSEVAPTTPRPGGLREVALLAYPLVLTQMSITAMAVVDSAIVGFFVGTSTAVQTFVAQLHGAGRGRECGAWSWQGLASLAPLAAMASVLVFVGADAIMVVLAPTESIAPLATGYMRARALGIVGITAAVTMSSFFRGLGDARTPLYATLTANALNLVLDYGLVFGELGMPRLGVVGAGLATAIAEWVYFLFLAVIFLKPGLARSFDTRPQRPAWKEIKRLWYTGGPIGGQWVLEMLSFAVFTTLVARMGDAAMAASHAYVQLLSLSFMQATGISTATATLVGRYIGAQRYDFVARSFRSSIGLAAALGCLIAAPSSPTTRPFSRSALRCCSSALAINSWTRWPSSPTVRCEGRATPAGPS